MVVVSVSRKNAAQVESVDINVNYVVWRKENPKYRNDTKSSCLEKIVQLERGSATYVSYLLEKTTHLPNVGAQRLSIVIVIEWMAVKYILIKFY